MDMRHGNSAWTCGKEMQHRHAARLRSMDLHGMDMHSVDMQHENMDMQHEDMDVQHGHGNVTWIWTCNIDMRMKHRYGHIHHLLYCLATKLAKKDNRQLCEKWTDHMPLLMRQHLPLFSLKFILAVRVN
jgi:hypothetical protein